MGALCLHFIPEEGRDRSPLPQPANTWRPPKSLLHLRPPTLLRQLEPGSHPGLRASTAPFVYGCDVRRWCLRALGPSPVCSCPTSAARVSALDTALLPFACLQPYFWEVQKGGPPGWVFILGCVAPKQGRIKGGIGGRNENYSTFPEAAPPLGECQLLRTTSPSVLFEQPRRRNQTVAIATILDCFQHFVGQGNAVLVLKAA